MKLDYADRIIFLLKELINNKLWAKILLAIFLGLIVGMLLGKDLNLLPVVWTVNIAKWLAFPGDIFMKLVQMIMIPLIFASIISGIVSSPIQKLKSNGGYILFYFFLTTIVSVVIGGVISIWINPGQYFYSSELKAYTSSVETTDFNSDFFHNIPGTIVDVLPQNPLASMVSGEMLTIVVFTFILGFAITQLKEKEKNTVLSLLNAVQEICLTIIRWSMMIIPYAVFGLIAKLVSTLGIESFKGLGVYVGTVLLGLLVMVLIYLIALYLFTNTSPIVFLKKIKEVQLLAFSTTSSAAVMPLSIKTAREELNVSEDVSNLIIPLGTTINMDGTAIYQCISIVFITQVCGLVLSLPQLLFIMITIILASIGTPGVPGAGIIILASVLEDLGIPASALMIIVGVERVLGMFRTTVNVTGDLTASIIFDTLLNKKNTKRGNENTSISVVD